MRTVRFPSGDEYKGRTWDDVEARVRANGWNPLDPRAFRAEMARRAGLWTGRPVPISPTCTSDALFRALAAAGCCTIS